MVNTSQKTASHSAAELITNEVVIVSRREMKMKEKFPTCSTLCVYHTCFSPDADRSSEANRGKGRRLVHLMRCGLQTQLWKRCCGEAESGKGFFTTHSILRQGTGWSIESHMHVLSYVSVSPNRSRWWRFRRLMESQCQDLGRKRLRSEKRSHHPNLSYALLSSLFIR